jgi:hypothetical protein
MCYVTTECHTLRQLHTLAGIDIHGSVHCRLLSINTNKVKLCNRIYYSNIFKGLTCFERHISYHQELQTVFSASGLYAHMVTGRKYSLELLMISGVLLETR